MSSPLFSIIIPTYNRRQLLQRAVESVLSQKYNGWELIIVDDGSVDNTKQYINNIKDDRIQYYYQSNRGESTARNVGLNKSKGKYICFLDSDDELLPDYLNFFFSKIQDGINILCCGVRLQWEDREKKIDIIPKEDNKEFTKQVLTGHFNLMPFCFNREIVKPFSEDIEMGEDFMFIVPLVARNIVVTIREIQCIVYEHSGRFTRSKYETPRIKEFKKSSIAIINQHKSNFEKTISSKELKGIIKGKMESYILGISQHSIYNALEIWKENNLEFRLNPMKTRIVFRRLKYIMKNLLRIS